MVKLKEQQRWLVTGCAGFIGSHLVEELLKQGQYVVGVDNFITGKPENLVAVERSVGSNWKNFKFYAGNIADYDVICYSVTQNIDIVLHNAALGSVPRSFEMPLKYNHNNVVGFANLLEACKFRHIKRVVYASSSSVYGDLTQLPFHEDEIGNAKSPYAATKQMNEIWAQTYRRMGLNVVGLRYFNVYGPRANSEGQYANVIPKWINAIQKGEPVYINGDRFFTARDFTYVSDVVQANLLAATSDWKNVHRDVYNVATGRMTNLDELLEILCERMGAKVTPICREAREGDMLYTCADIGQIQQHLKYKPQHDILSGITATLSSVAH